MESFSVCSIFLPMFLQVGTGWQLRFGEPVGCADENYCTLSLDGLLRSVEGHSISADVFAVPSNCCLCVLLSSPGFSEVSWVPGVGVVGLPLVSTGFRLEHCYTHENRGMNLFDFHENS